MPIQDELGPKIRDLMFRVIDSGESELLFHQVAGRMHYLHETFPPNFLEAALKWLVANGTTGAKFMKWYLDELKGSPLELHRRLLEAVTKDDPTHLIAGKNFRIL